MRCTTPSPSKALPAESCITRPLVKEARSGTQNPCRLNSRMYWISFSRDTPICNNSVETVLEKSDHQIM